VSQAELAERAGLSYCTCVRIAFAARLLRKQSIAHSLSMATTSNAWTSSGVRTGISMSIVERFARTCHADERVVAAFISGSHASGTADAHSDIDLGLITTDAAYNDFQASRTAFISCLGEAIFAEDFDNDDTIFFILSDGTEGELSVGSTSHYGRVARGPYQVLLDKSGILAGASFSAAAGLPWAVTPRTGVTSSPHHRPRPHRTDRPGTNGWHWHPWTTQWVVDAVRPNPVADRFTRNDAGQRHGCS
jgi:hypothetical protein